MRILLLQGLKNVTCESTPSGQKTEKLHPDNKATLIRTIDFQRFRSGFSFSEILQNFKNKSFHM